MKKLFSLLSMLICAVLLLSTAFAAETDAYTIYKKCVKKMQSLSSMEISGTVKATYTTASTSTVKKWNVKSRTLTDKGGKLQFEAIATNTDSGEAIYEYYKDGYSYIDFLDGTELIREIDENAALVSSLYLNYKLPKSAFKDATVEKVDGGTKITCKIKNVDSSNSDVSYASATYSFVIGDDGMLKSYSSSDTTVSSPKTGSVKTKISRSMKIKAVNSITKIDFQRDLDAY